MAGEATDFWELSSSVDVDHIPEEIKKLSIQNFWLRLKVLRAISGFQVSPFTRVLFRFRPAPRGLSRLRLYGRRCGRPSVP